MDDDLSCPTHRDMLWPVEGPVRRCLAPGCGFTVRGPAPELTYEYDYMTIDEEAP